MDGRGRQEHGMVELKLKILGTINAGKFSIKTEFLSFALSVNKSKKSA